MKRMKTKSISSAVVLAMTATSLLPLHAAPTAQETLSRFKPIQSGVDYDQPTAAQAAEAMIESIKVGDSVGYQVSSANGEILRQFMDTNGDQSVDRWSYFKSGVEVYRDIDLDYNGRAENFRWLGPAGIRWGVDSDDDRQIDSWKFISAQEVTQEFVAAAKSRDVARFARLFASDSELARSGFGGAKVASMKEARDDAVQAFAKAVTQKTLLPSGVQWVHFSGMYGVLPQGAGGRSQDVFVYDNVIAIVEDGANHRQLVVGAMLESGKAWRLVQFPPALQDAEDSVAASGYFFNSPVVNAGGVGAAPMQGVSEAAQKMLGELERIDKDLAQAATPARIAELNDLRAAVLLRLVGAASTADDRSQWVRQFADTVSAAVQSGEFPAGMARLESVVAASADYGVADRAYVKFRLLTAGYSKALSVPEADFDKVQEKWLADLSGFVNQFPASSDAPEALFQLGIAEEFAGNETQAIKYYAEIGARYGDSPNAAKAEGARRRLELKGRPLALVAKTLDGKTLDTRSLEGKVVVLHYWASWSEPSVKDMSQLRDLQAKFGNRLSLVGVNVDVDSADAQRVIQQNRYSWSHLYSKGGMESQLANQLGVVSVPMMIVVDATGKVVKTGVHSAELSGILNGLIK